MNSRWQSYVVFAFVTLSAGIKDSCILSAINVYKVGISDQIKSPDLTLENDQKYEVRRTARSWGRTSVRGTEVPTGRSGLFRLKPNPRQPSAPSSERSHPANTREPCLKAAAMASTFPASRDLAARSCEREITLIRLHQCSIQS